MKDHTRFQAFREPYRLRKKTVFWRNLTGYLALFRLKSLIDFMLCKVFNQISLITMGLPSSSTSAIISRSSSSDGSCPSCLITVPSSSQFTVPSPSLSNRRNVSRRSTTQWGLKKINLL